MDAPHAPRTSREHPQTMAIRSIDPATGRYELIPVCEECGEPCAHGHRYCSECE